MYLIGGMPPASTSFAAANARAEHDVDDAGLDEPRHKRHERPVVLIVGMQHHNDVGIGLERQPVTRFLIAAVAAVLGVAVDFDSELARHVDRVVGAGVVDENDVLTRAARQSLECGLQRLRGVIRGQDDTDREILYFRKMARQRREYTLAT